MKNRSKLSAVLSTVLMSTVFLTATTASGRNLRAGAVFVLTNQVSNAIAVFERGPDGTLTSVGTSLTGGAGDPVAQAGDLPTDPLASQGSLILDNNLLFAVNAGSNEISVLRVGKDDLTLVDKESSGGVRPISLTIHNNFLYVLNEGGTPNISGFTVGSDGSLTPLAGSTRLLPAGGADPAQVGFSPDGTLLTVTEKLGNSIDTFVVGANGVAGAANSDLSSGQTPFGFAFRGDGVLVIAEAFSAVANQGKASSYTTAADGSISVISRSVPDSQTTASRLVITDSGKVVFVSNTGSSSISSYQLDSLGTLSLLRSVAANTGSGTAPIDMALSDRSKYLYVNDNAFQMVRSFVINKDGTLTSIDNDGGLPFGIQGIAAR